MRLRASNVVLTLIFLLLLGFAHLPHLRAELLAGDRRALLEAASSEAGGPLLERVSLRASGALFGTAGDVPATAFRLENLGWLACAAIALVFFARRLLEPRAGSEQARAASRAAGVLLLLHPLVPAAAASLAARGEILGLALALGAAALFLWGRQEGRYGAIVASLVLSILAGLAAPIALGLPLLLAACEFFSAHRYRPRSLRLRTATTTFLVFGAGAALGSWIGGLAAEGLHPGRLALRAEETIEELGLLVLPSNPALLGVGGSVLAGALFLLAMQPALVAARSAPRLWGGLLAGGLVAFLGAELLRFGPRASSQRFDLAVSLLPAITVVALGLGLSTTALSGVRRPWIAFIVALGYACLAHANSRAWLDAGAEVTRLRSELVAASTNAAPAARFLVLDPPAPTSGVDPLGSGLAWLLHPGLGASVGFDPLRVRGLAREAFLAFAREPEFAALRREPLVLLVTQDVVEPGASRAAPRAVFVISAGEPSGSVRSWRDDLVSPQLDLDPFEFGALRASADIEVEGKELERLSWRAPETGPFPRGALAGVVRENGGEHEAVFDLSRSLPWRLAGRVRLLLFEQGTRLRSIERAELVPDLPAWGEGMTPETDGADWIFERPEDPPGEVAGRVSLALALLDLEELSFLEIPLESEGDRLRARGAALFAAEHEIAWTIDYRIGGLAVARARGRVP